MVLLDSKGLAKAGAPHARGKCPIPLGGHIERECEGPDEYQFCHGDFVPSRYQSVALSVVVFVG